MTGRNASDSISNDVWKTADLVNWSQVIANGHAQFARRRGAAVVL